MIFEKPLWENAACSSVRDAILLVVDPLAAAATSRPPSYGQLNGFFLLSAYQ
jgi:hypothetical protein